MFLIVSYQLIMYMLIVLVVYFLYIKKHHSIIHLTNILHSRRVTKRSTIVIDFGDGYSILILDLSVCNGVSYLE